MHAHTMIYLILNNHHPPERKVFLSPKSFFCVFFRFVFFLFTSFFSCVVSLSLSFTFGNTSETHSKKNKYVCRFSFFPFFPICFHWIIFSVHHCFFCFLYFTFLKIHSVNKNEKLLSTKDRILYHLFLFFLSSLFWVSLFSLYMYNVFSFFYPKTHDDICRVFKTMIGWKLKAEWFPSVGSFLFERDIFHF